MNQNQVTASLAIVAVSNGTTVNGYVRVDNGPLIQAWTKGSDKYTPDFEALALSHDGTSRHEEPRTHLRI
ncbi:hypothetical protein [Bacteroides sp.]|uniref:hypothetical protein n=1 Tax=Bacteroides sp. TaxID=29523 RepID=UPI002583D9B3|nr:hypothetical protein [Bacteroides sp.]